MYGVITFCLLFANFKLFFKPTINSLKETLPQVKELQSKVIFVRNSIANIPRYKIQIEDLRKKLSFHKKKFSTKKEISYLLKELSDMAKDSGVKITAIKPYPAITTAELDGATTAYQKFPISIKATCGYHQLGSFLSELENADTFMRISDIRITETSQNPLEHLVYILVNTYIITESNK